MAKWIWHKKKYDKNEYVDFIKDINISEISERFIIRISADSEYVLWINGVFVDCGQYDDYPENKVYDTLDIKKYMQRGLNRIAIAAYYQGESSFQYANGNRGLWFEIEGDGKCYFSDTDVKCRISNEFRNGEIYKTTSQLGFSFGFDARNTDNWKNIGFELGDEWENAVVVQLDTNLSGRPIDKLSIGNHLPAKIMAQGYFKRKKETGDIAQMIYSDYMAHVMFEDLCLGAKTFPIKVKDSNRGNNVYLVIDLCKESCGFFTMTLKAASGCMIDVGYGEHLNDLRVRSKIETRNFAFRYICKDGKQEFTYYFKRIAGRYIQLHISGAENVEIDYAGIKPVWYPMTYVERFESEDALHSKIFDICVDTLRLCMHEHYEDCPWREQALYSLDSRNQALFGYYAFKEYQFARASIDLMGQRFKKDGQLNICSPSDEKLTIPSFSLWWVVALKEYTEHSKDTSLAVKYWGQVIEIIGSNTQRIKDDLTAPPAGDIYWHFYEWVDGYADASFEEKAMRKQTGFVDGVYNLIFYLTLKEAIWLAEKLADKENLKRMENIRAKLKNAFNKNFWNDEKEMYSSFRISGVNTHYGELVQALALYTEMGDEKQLFCLNKILTGQNDIKKISLCCMVFKYEALAKYDINNSKYIRKDIEKIWGNMLYRGATSFWETVFGENDFDGAGSLCHGWSATPIYMYLKYNLMSGRKSCVKNFSNIEIHRFSDACAESRKDNIT